MKANLLLENIGQIIGVESWEFNSGVITEIRGRTASGKSRILKSCALALSLPITSEEIKTNAIGFGIAKADNAECSPLLNSSKNRAVIELHYNDLSRIVEIKRDGTENINIAGNQEFLYCSMLVENSKIHTYIDQGKPDFSWIVTEMSLAKDYEAIQDIVNSYSDLLNSKKEEIEKKEIEKKKNQDLLNKRKKELDETNNEVEKIEKELNAIKIDPKLKTDRQKLMEDLDTFKKRQANDNKKHKDLQNELSTVKNDIDKNKSTIERHSKRIEELKTEKKELEEIEVILINKEIERILKENGNLRESKGTFQEKINNLKEKINDLNDSYKKLIKTSEEKVLCWTCNNGYISKPDLEKRLEVFKKEKEDSQKELDDLNKKIDNNNEEHLSYLKDKERKNKIPDIVEEYETLSKKVGDLGTERDKFGERRKEIEAEIPSYTENIESRAKKIKQKAQELKTIEDKLEKNKQVKPKLDKKNKLTKKLGDRKSVV